MSEMPVRNVTRHLETSRDIDQSVFDEMIDIFGSKVLSKLKKKDRKQPDCSQEGNQKFRISDPSTDEETVRGFLFRAMFSSKLEIIFIWLVVILIIIELILMTMISNM